MDDFRGIGVAMITPFTAMGEVDYNALEALIEQYIQSGIDFLVVQGTTAETVTLTKQEKENLAQRVVDINARSPAPHVR